LPVRRALSKAGNVAAAKTVNDKAVEQFNTIQAALGKLTAINQREAVDSTKAISSATSSSKTMTIVLIAIALLVGLGFAFLTVRFITRPVKDCIERTHAIAKAARERLQMGMQVLQRRPHG
jgi:hypothetical protein